MLADDDLGDLLLVRCDVVLVDLLAIQEKDEIGVLLEGATFAKVGELRSEITMRPRFHRSRQLGQRDHGNVELLRQRLQRPRDLGDFLLPVLLTGTPSHELEVVDDEKLEAVLGLQPTGLRTRLQHREPRTVVDEDLGLGEAPGGGGQPMPVRRIEVTGSHRMSVDLRLGTEHSLHELLRRHLEAENEHRATEMHPDVLRDVQRERRLAHTRSRRDDDEIRRLKA